MFLVPAVRVKICLNWKYEPLKCQIIAQKLFVSETEFYFCVVIMQSICFSVLNDHMHKCSIILILVHSKIVQKSSVWISTHSNN